MEKNLPPAKKTENSFPKTADLDDLELDEPLPDISEDLLLSENLEDPELDSVLTEFNVKPEKKSKLTISDTKITTKTINGKPSSIDIEQNSSKFPNTKTSIPFSPLKIPVAILKEFTFWLKQKQSVYEEIAFITILRKIPRSWGISNEDLLIDLLEKFIEEKIISGKLTAISLKLYPDSL